MMKRLKLAIGILLGQPLCGIRIDEELFLDKDKTSGLDYTQTAPFDLVFGDVVEDGPPVEVFKDNRFRVCVFSEKKQGATCDCGGRTCRWLVLEFRGDKKWHHLVTMHEGRLAVMLRVLHQVGDYLDGYRVASECQSETAGDYHGELGCLGDNHQRTLTVDASNEAVNATQSLVRLVLYEDTTSLDLLSQQDLAPVEARELATHLLKAADAAEYQGKQPALVPD